MSIYAVNVHEHECDGRHQTNLVLRKLAQIFNGNIIMRNTNYGSFIVSEDQSFGRDEQIRMIRQYFAENATAMTVEELPNECGHIVFEVDVACPPQYQPEF